MSRIAAYIRLMRLPNLPTAAADVIAGAAICGFLAQASQLWVAEQLIPLGKLMLASVCLYAGGVVLNDFFDAGLDAVERPERPIPSGAATRRGAALLGFGLLVIGIGFAFWQGWWSGIIASFLGVTIVFYDAVAKKIEVLGPLAMGVCRGLNLWLGMSLIPDFDPWRFLWIPVLYIFAVTLVSRGEVWGGRKSSLIFALVLYAIVIFGVGILAGTETGYWAICLPFLAFFGIMVIRPLWIAIGNPQPLAIRKAVKSGVIGIVALDATWAAAYGHWFLGLAVLGLMALSFWIARQHAVT